MHGVRICRETTYAHAGAVYFEDRGVVGMLDDPDAMAGTVDDDVVSAIFEVDGSRMRVSCLSTNPNTMHVATATTTSTWVNTLGQRVSADGDASSGHILAPMHGLLLDLNVRPGDNVAVGDKLLVLEAMKMQHELRAGVAGTVKSVHAEPGSQVSADSLIVEIEPGETA